MIFAFCDDRVLTVFDDIHAVRRHCEGIDIENGEWHFFDDKGQPLKAVFSQPNIVKKHFFGLVTSIRSSPAFDLLPDMAAASLLLRLPELQGIDTHRFQSVADLQRFLEQHI